MSGSSITSAHKGWEAGVKDGQGLTLKNGEWSLEMKL